MSLVPILVQLRIIARHAGKIITLNNISEKLTHLPTYNELTVLLLQMWYSGLQITANICGCFKKKQGALYTIEWYGNRNRMPHPWNFCNYSDQIKGTVAREMFPFDDVIIGAKSIYCLAILHTMPKYVVLNQLRIYLGAWKRWFAIFWELSTGGWFLICNQPTRDGVTL